MGISLRNGWRFRLLSLLSALAILVSACETESQHVNPHNQDISLSIMVPLHQKQVPRSDIVQLIEQMTNRKLDINWVPNEIYRDKLINAIETNILKKAVYVGQQDYAFVKNAIRSNMFWEIGPYLDAYPNLRKLSKTILDETAINGKIYGLYTERPLSRQGILIRKDWLDRLNMKEPSTVEELYEVVRRFTVDDPDGNGKSDTIGLTDRNDLLYGAFKTLSSYFGTPNNWGIVDGKLVPEFKTKEYVDTMNFMKRLYQENLINKDFAVTSKEVQRYTLISGKAGVFIGSMTDAPELEEAMKKINPNAELAIVNRIRGEKGLGVWSIPGYSGMFLFSKKTVKTEEELKGILAFFDRSMESDVSNLLQYGIQGVHYTVQNGEVVITSEMNRLRTNEMLLSLSMLIVSGISNPNILKLSGEGEDRLLMLANRLSEDNGRFLINDAARTLSSSTYDERGGELSQIIANATYNYILGQIDLKGFQSEVEKWEKRGGGQIVSEFNEAYLNQIKK